jgi:hypothetical protein
MEIHCNKKHQWVKSNGNDGASITDTCLGNTWTRQNYQTFFPSIHHKFFAVSMEDPLNNIDALSLMNCMLDEAKLKDNEPLQNLHVVCKDEGKAEMSLWLTRTGWKDTFQGKDMSELVSFTKTDKGEDHVIAFIDQSVPRIIDCCMKGVKDLRSRGWDEIRFWLMSLDKEKPSRTPFRLNYQDLTSYTDAWH